MCTVVKFKVEISPNFVAFSEYMNFKRKIRWARFWLIDFICPKRNITQDYSIVKDSIMRIWQLETEIPKKTHNQ